MCERGKSESCGKRIMSNRRAYTRGEKPELVYVNESFRCKWKWNSGQSGPQNHGQATSEQAVVSHTETELNGSSR